MNTQKLLWIFLAFIAGSFLPIQAGLNSKLGKAIESPLHSSMISFIVGAMAMIVYVFATQQNVSWAGLKTIPVYTWIGGVLGAFYVTIIIFSFPKLGPGLTFGLVVAGQLVISLILEQFNILVAQPHPINFLRLLGIILVIAGVIIIKIF
jgi:transporter family-2 protein